MSIWVELESSTIRNALTGYRKRNFEPYRQHLEEERRSVNSKNSFGAILKELMRFGYKKKIGNVFKKGQCSF